jgi:hypothetical protein
MKVAESFVLTKFTPCYSTGLEGKMKQEVYRFAFEEANSELTEIVGEFEQLRARKERIEKVIEALKPFASVDSLAPSNQQASEQSPFSFQTTPAPSSYSY